MIVVDERGDSTIEVVIHLLLSDEVAYGPCHLRIQLIFEQGALTLVLLVVALSLGIVQGSVQAQYLSQTLVPDKLIVLLVVVVRLVVVVSGVTICIVVFST